ncbi:hypothetical protein GE543_20795 [Pseudomonas sp. SZ57]|nr:hypothetical protein [Pseudomonas sp. SZ57]
MRANAEHWHDSHTVRMGTIGITECLRGYYTPQASPIRTANPATDPHRGFYPAHPANRCSPG